MFVTLATLRVKAQLRTETSSRNVCAMTLQKTLQQPLQLVSKTKQRETVALLWLHCVARLVFKLSILLSSPLEHHRKYALCFEESQQSTKVRYLKNVYSTHVASSYVAQSSMVKQTSKNASVYHVLNTKLSVLELKNTSRAFSAFIEWIKHISFRSLFFIFSFGFYNHVHISWET